MEVKSKNGETLNFLYSGVDGIYVLDHAAFKGMFDEDDNNDWEKSSGKKKLQEWAEKNLPAEILERFDIDLPTIDEIYSQKTLNLLPTCVRSKQLPIFQDSDNHMIEFKGKVTWWWTRSICFAGSSLLWGISSGGFPFRVVARCEFGFVPVLRKKE